MLIKIMNVKVSRSLRVLCKLSGYLSVEILKTLYLSLILPYLTYAIEVWHGTYKNTTEKLFVLQKISVRIIKSLNNNDHTTSHFRELQLLKLSDLYKYHILVFTYKTLILKENGHVLTFQQQSDNHNYATRNRAAICIPLFKRTKSHFSVLYSAAYVWNALSAIVRDCDSLARPTTDLKRYM